MSAQAFPASTPDPAFAPMRAADLDEVMEIEKASYSVPWGRGHFSTSLTSDYLAFCLRGAREELAGYCVLMPAVDEMHILNLTVAHAWRRRGLAQRMLAEAVARADERGMSGLLLDVRPSNEGAIAAYRSYGFEEIGRRRGYYSTASGGREDAIVMRLRLEDFGGKKRA